MRDVHECALLDLGVALCNPGRKALGVHSGMPCQSSVHGVDNEVEEIGLICMVAVGATAHYPVRATCSEHLRTGGAEMDKEMTPGTTIARRFASNQALIHGLVIASLNGPVELWVDLRLEDCTTVKSDGAVHQSTWSQEGE